MDVILLESVVVQHIETHLLMHSPFYLNCAVRFVLIGLSTGLLKLLEKPADVGLRCDLIVRSPRIEALVHYIFHFPITRVHSPGLGLLDRSERFSRLMYFRLES